MQHRDRNGGFGYRSGANGWDLSNTQYAVLGLRAAQAIGVEIDRAVWAKVASCIGAE